MVFEAVLKLGIENLPRPAHYTFPLLRVLTLQIQIQIQIQMQIQIEIQIAKHQYQCKSTSPCLYTLFQEGEHGFTLEIHFQEHLENSLFQISRTYTFGITSVQLACDVLHSSALVSATFHRV